MLNFLKLLLVCNVFLTILVKSRLFLSSLSGSCLLRIVHFLRLLVFSLFLLNIYIVDLFGFLMFLFLFLFELSSLLESLLVGLLLGLIKSLLGFRLFLGFLFFLLLVKDSFVLGGQDLSCLLDFLVLLEMLLSLIPLFFGLHLLIFQLLKLTLNLLDSVFLCFLLDLLSLLLKLLRSVFLDFYHLLGCFLLHFLFYLGGLFLLDLSFCFFLNLLS